jgi:hypothetical protein
MILFFLFVMTSVSAYAADYVPATDEQKAINEAKEISGRSDPFNPLVSDDGLDRSSVGAGLSATGVFVDNAMRLVILQYRGKTQVVRQGGTFMDWRVVQIGKNTVNLLHSNGTQVSLIVGGK